MYLNYTWLRCFLLSIIFKKQKLQYSNNEAIRNEQIIVILLLVGQGYTLST